MGGGPRSCEDSKALLGLEMGTIKHLYFQGLHERSPMEQAEP